MLHFGLIKLTGMYKVDPRNHILKLPLIVVSLLLQGHQSMLHPQLESAMLQVVFDRANLSNHSVISDAVVQLWLQNRLGPLLFNLSHAHVAPFFSIVAGRNCSVQQQG